LKTRSYTLTLLPILLGAFLMTGCPPKKKLAIDEKAKEEKTQEDVNASTDTTKTAREPGDIEINQDWTEIPNLQLVRFGYDSASLDDAARAALKNNVSILKKLPKTVTVRVEGHCDDRGTVEYNIA